MATLHVRDENLKMLRETLCIAQARIVHLTPGGAKIDHHVELLGDLIREIDIHRPLGSDGKHGSLHTPTCGCEDKV
jgi:hypothetical protein